MNMDLDGILGRMRLQIKHGRTEGLEKKIYDLLDRYRGDPEELVILELYALEYLAEKSDYRQAIPVLERLLSFNTSAETRERATTLYRYYKDKSAVVPSQVDLESPGFIEFLNIIRGWEMWHFNPALEEINEYEIIKSLLEAKRIAWRGDVRAPFKPWNSLRSQASGELYSYCNEKKIDTAPLKTFTAELLELCNKKIPDSMRDFFDDIYGDLYEIGKGKVLGVATHLHNEMWNAYQKMAFPCGWKGNYPNGRLCIFVSPDSSGLAQPKIAS